jgi:hypothetical protein
VDGGEGSRARALLRLVGARPVGALRARENAARGNEEDVTVGELLLELTGETDNVSATCKTQRGAHKPLLHLVPALEKGNRDEDDNGLPAVADLDLRILVSAKLPSAQRLFDRTVCMCMRACDGCEAESASSGGVCLGQVVLHLTSRAETNCSGRRALLMSVMLFWRSSRALLMAVSISEGEARDGLLGAILESCPDMLAVVECRCRKSRNRDFLSARSICISASETLARTLVRTWLASVDSHLNTMGGSSELQHPNLAYLKDRHSCLYDFLSICIQSFVHVSSKIHPIVTRTKRSKA